MIERRMAPIVGGDRDRPAACSAASGGSPPRAQADPPPDRPASAGAGCNASACRGTTSSSRAGRPHDKPNIQKTVEAAGGKYIDADANLKSEQQATDIDTLISKGAKVLIVLAQDPKPVLPAVAKAKDAGIPVIGYDRLIEDPKCAVHHVRQHGVGKAEAEAIIEKVPKGNYVLIKGDPADPNAKTFLPAGWDQAGLKDKVASGDIKIIGPADGTYTDAWKTEKAQANMESIIDSADSQARRSTRSWPRTTARRSASSPRSGQELRLPAAQRPGRRRRQPEQRRAGQAVRRHLEERQRARQDGRRRPRSQLCNGGTMASLKLPDGLIDPAVAPTAGLTAGPFKTPGGNTVSSFTLQPTPITADNLQVVLDGGQITKAELCKGVDASKAPAACK